MEDITRAAGRVRETLDELRPPAGEDVRALVRKVEALEARVARLERARRRAGS
jgi:hypothetical protein